MKYYIATGCALLAAVAALWFVNNSRPLSAHAQWKRNAVEQETKARPERFQAMKYDPAAQERLPASDKK